MILNGSIYIVRYDWMSRAKDDGQITGLVPHLVDGGLSILQYADDTVLFMEHNMDQAKNMKLLVFEKQET
jgi:hypothetical protein